MSEEDNRDISSDDQKPSISAYLQAPRKKRKNYVLVAVRQGFDKGTVQQIEGHVKKYHGGLAFAQSNSLQDLRRQLNRTISLLVLDDEFAPLPALLQLLAQVRKKRRKEVIPVLFFTRNSARLIETYHQELSGYQEIDEFVEYVNLERSQIIGRVKVGIEQKNRRRSRRFSCSTDINFFLLRKDTHLKGRLLDLSLHGAMIESSDGEIFKVGDQLKLLIPGDHFLSVRAGEFLRLSAKVRRVFISGTSAGVSFEYVSENQSTMLTKFIAGVMTNSLAVG